jgi:hypothetical protein
MQHTSAAAYLGYCSGWPEGNPQDPRTIACPLTYECKFVERISLAENKTTQQTMTFFADKTVIQKTFPDFVPTDPTLRKGVTEDRVHSLTDFLSRPIRLTNGVWSTTDARNTELYTADLPEAAFLASPQFVEKIQGFLGFRAKAVVRVQINAQRFQQGRLLMHYVPQGQINVPRRQIIMRSLPLKTQTPRVELDCSTTSAASLEMPYVSTTTHFNTQDYTGPIGSFHLCVYSPLVSPAASTLDYTVWVHFEDIELAFPAIPFTAHAGIASSIKESIDAGHKPISKMFGGIKVVADALKTVPLLSAGAGTVSWASGILGGWASSIGWSAPISSTTTTLITQAPHRYMQNVTKVDVSANLGLDADNQVEVLDGFAGTGKDEMSFAHIAKIPSFVGYESWSVSDPTDTILYSQVLQMDLLNSSRSVAKLAGNLTVYDLIPAAYIANYFKNYRSSFNFTFKFIKTEFHSGRVLVCFSPSHVTDPSAANVNYLYREVLDLRSSNEFVVTIPYVSTKPYRNYTDGFGIVTMFVLNELVAPTTVSQSIEILVEISAGPDFEVAIPANPTTYCPIIQAQSLPASEFYAQGLGENEAEINKPSTVQETVDPIASSDVNSGELAAARYCVGERILSFRQMLKRFTQCAYLDSNGAPVNWSFNLFDVMLPRFNSGADPIKFAFSNTSRCFPVIDLYSAITPMFMFKRGGIRLKLSPQYPRQNLDVGSGAGLYKAIVITTRTADTLTFSGTLSPPGLVGTGPSLHSCSTNSGLEIQHPQYTAIQQSHVTLVNASSYTYNQSYENNGRVQINDTVVVSSSTLTRAIADDFSCGFFIGVLPCLTSGVLVTYNPLQPF